MIHKLLVCTLKSCIKEAMKMNYNKLQEEGQTATECMIYGSLQKTKWDFISCEKIYIRVRKTFSNGVM